jgi:uncharacterized protein YycO
MKENNANDVIKVAFYKGTRPGIKGVYNIGVRAWTRSDYSHVELIFPDGQAASSSAEDGGVRYKDIVFDSNHWDILELPASIFKARAEDWFDAHLGEGYDFWGNVHFVVGFVGGNKKRWFCSEAVGAALGIPTPERLDPGTLYAVVKALADLYSATLASVHDTTALQVA